MSHNPPNGPPPPYYGYPSSGSNPPHPGAYTYVPAPIMMPMYHPPPPQPPPEPVPQPTYVTNYIYQQQPAPPPPQPILVEVTEVHPPPQTSKPMTPAEIGLATVGKGLAWLGSNLQNLNNKKDKWKDNSYSHIPQSLSMDKELIDWVPATPTDVSSLSHRAYIAGKEGWDGSPLCVIRAHHNGEFIPGKLAIKHRSAYVPHAGREVPVHNFEVLCAPTHAVRWLPSSNGQVPVGAIAAGNTHHGEPLYVARVRHMRSITPGKVHPSHGCAYISFGGQEISFKNYEVLCKIVG